MTAQNFDSYNMKLNNCGDDGGDGVGVRPANGGPPTLVVCVLGQNPSPSLRLSGGKRCD